MGGCLLIFFALENPSPFGAAADGLTPSPHPALGLLGAGLGGGVEWAESNHLLALELALDIGMRWKPSKHWVSSTN